MNCFSLTGNVSAADSSILAGITIRPSWIPTSAPIHSDISDRSPQLYQAVIDQFVVEVNPRYAPRDGKTYCNIFLWDVTRAMNAEIPHWVNLHGSSCPPNSINSHRMNANSIWQWLNDIGLNYGWQNVDRRNAIRSANKGQPTIAISYNNRGHGHCAIVRPCFVDEIAPLYAQAGSKCFSLGNTLDAFAEREPAFWTHK